MPEFEIVRSDSPRVPELEAAGYRLVDEAWGARLRFIPGAKGALDDAIARADVTLAELGREYAVAVFELETASNAAHGMTPAMMRRDRSLATITELWDESRLFGALDGNRLVGVAGVSRDGESAEVDFASVLTDYRGQGVGVAVVAYAILEVGNDGARDFHTGGPADHSASLATARALGFTIDERWLTYSR